MIKRALGLILATAVFLCLIGCNIEDYADESADVTSSALSDSEMLFYKNEKYGFAVTYPNSIHIVQDDEVSVVFIDETGSSTYTVGLWGTDVADNEKAMERLRDEELSAILDATDEDSINYSTVYEDNVTKVINLYYTRKNSDELRRANLGIKIHGDEMYMVTASYPFSVEGAYIYNQLYSSLKESLEAMPES